ncbi:MAG: GntR family transcriptional regulator [Lentisphaeria bacterium]|nr:GntR family transcriptional regulator [Lentisphaeria bacterium]
MPTKKKSCNNENLHQHLLALLRRQAVTSESGSRFPSEASVSKRYKVSRSTVSRVYNELESAGYLIRKQGCGTFVPAEPLYRICYLLPFDTIRKNHDTELVVRGESLQKRCLEQSIPFEYIEASSKRNSRELNAEQFNQSNKNTVFVISGYFFRGIFDRLISQKSNVVFVTAQHELDPLYRERLKKWQTIEIDRRGGMVKLVNELAEKGCKNIALLHNLPHHQHPLLRGYRLGLKLNKLQYKPQLIMNMIGGMEYIQRRLDTLFELKSIYPFDAIIIISESLARTVSLAWSTMNKPGKEAVYMALVSKNLPAQPFPFPVLHLYQPLPETVTDCIMESAKLNIPPGKHIIPMLLTWQYKTNND